MEIVKQKLSFKIAIIGGGPAGLFAASQVSYFKFSNCIIEENEYVGGQVMQLYPNKPVYDFPGSYGSLAKDIIKNLCEQLSHYSESKTFLSNKIESIIKDELTNNFIITTNKLIIECEYIILATGIGSCVPNKLEIDNKVIDFENVHYSVSFDSSIYKDKRIVVLGGGESAIDWANYFAINSITNKIAIVHRRDEYRANNKGIDQLKENNIQEFLNYKIIDVTNNYLIVQHNQTNQKYKIHYDYLIVQYGQKSKPSNIHFLNDLNKNEINKYIVDQNQKTNIKNVFAIGSSTTYNAKANTIVTACGEATAVAWYLAKNKLEW